MPNPPIQQIPPEPPQQVTQNFARLLEIGRAAAQRLSSDVWTDYNEHDPGVTILDALCYAMTDLGYRTAHPIEDILASSMAQTKTPLDKQPLFTGDRILTNAPLTQNDFRKLTYDQVDGLRNFWLRPPVGTFGRIEGLHRACVQTYGWEIGGSKADTLRHTDRTKVLDDVTACLHANRPLGEDFDEIREVGADEYRLDVDLTISPDADPDKVVADMLLRASTRISPAPRLSDVGADLEAGKKPVELFDGPRLEFGWIHSDQLAPFGSDVSKETIVDAIATTDGVLAAGALELDQVRVADTVPDPDRVAVLGRQAEDLKGIRVFRNGVSVALNPQQVFSHLLHAEEQTRWHAGYASRSLNELDYTKVPLGNPRRELGRYRSIQHLFPPAYDLAARGHLGAARPLGPLDDRDRNRQDGRRNQLKAYLLIFEQMIANHLAQLNQTARLFSWVDQDSTYAVGPLVGGADPEPDEPPEVQPVLGRGSRKDWLESYTEGIEKIAMDQDPVSRRVNRALDAMLARFNESLPERRLGQLATGKNVPRLEFEDWIAGQKRAFLDKYPELSARRGVGFDLTRPAETDLETAIRLVSGHDGFLCVVEHILLRSRRVQLAIPDMTVGHDFAVAFSEEIWTLKLQSDDFTLHFVADRNTPEDDWLQMAQRLVAVGTNAGNYVIGSPDGYRAAVRLQHSGGAFEILESFASRSAAARAVDRVAGILAKQAEVAGCLSELLVPVLLPIHFFERHVSVLLAEGPPGPDNFRSGQAYRNFVQSVVAERMPAHVRHHCYWPTKRQCVRLRRILPAWRDALRVLALTSEPSDACKRDAEQACRTLRLLVQELHVDRFLTARRALRESGSANRAGR